MAIRNLTRSLPRILFTWVWSLLRQVFPTPRRVASEAVHERCGNLAEREAVSSMREWKDVFVFSHPWETMVKAAYRKYPNPHCSNVHTLDTLQRRVTPTGNLFSHRIFGTMWSVPNIALNVSPLYTYHLNKKHLDTLVPMVKIIGTNPVMRVNEQSLCDPHKKTLIIQARNITLANLFTVHETLEYRVNPEDPTTTVLRQTARVSVHGVPLLGDLLERLFIHNYSTTVSNGRRGVEFVAQRIIEETS